MANNQTSWAQTQLKIVKNRAEIVKMITTLNIRIDGGTPAEQKSAALAAHLALINGETPENAIKNGVINGRRIMAFNGKPHA